MKQIVTSFFDFFNIFYFIKIILIILFFTLFCISCLAIKDPKTREMDYVTTLCSGKSMVDDVNKAKAAIKVKLEKVKSLELSGDYEESIHLNQKLEKYSADWEMLNKDMQMACKNWAICQYYRSGESSNACKEEHKEMKKSQESARNFFLKVKGFDIKKEINNENNGKKKSVAPPILSPLSGSFTDPITLSIDCNTPGATIHYTTDRSEPTEISSKYSVPIKITKATILKARAFKDNWFPSYIVRAEYKKILSKTLMPQIEKHKELSLSNPWTKKKSLSLLSGVIFGGTSYYLCQEAKDYNDRYLKECDKNEAKKLENKRDDYKKYSLVAASVGVGSLVYFVYLHWFKKIKETSKNKQSQIIIHFTPRKPEVSLALRF